MMPSECWAHLAMRSAAAAAAEEEERSKGPHLVDIDAGLVSVEGLGADDVQGRHALQRAAADESSPGGESSCTLTALQLFDVRIRGRMRGRSAFAARPGA